MATKIISGNPVHDFDAHKDVYIDQATPNDNHGAGTDMYVGTFAANIRRSLLQLKMPKQPDGAGKITQIRVSLFVGAYTAPAAYLGLRTCKKEYQAGDGTNTASTYTVGATWERFDGVTDWAQNGGQQATEIGEYMSDAVWVGATGQKWFDITAWAKNNDFTWEGVQNVFLVSDNEGTALTIRGSDYSNTAQRPQLEVTYEVEPTLVADKEDEPYLTVEPFIANPKHVHLKWKMPKDKVLKRDDGTDNGAFIVVKSLSPINDYGDGRVIARTQSLEFIDDNSAASLGAGQPWYYRILICDEENFLEGTTIYPTLMWSASDVTGAPLWSNQAEMEKPKVNSFLPSGSPPYSWNVWEERTMTVTCQAPTLDGYEINAYKYDWVGLGVDEVGWTELATPSNTDARQIRYSKDYTSPQPYPTVNARNAVGYVSEDYGAGTILLTPVNAIAEIRGSPMKVYTGNGFRLRADESLDPNGDGTITKYEFRIQRSSDNYYWTGATWQAASIWIDQGTTPFYDVPDAAITVAADYDCESRVTGSSAVAVASSAITIEAVSAAATNFRSGLDSETNIEMVESRKATQVTKVTPLEGTEDVRIVEAVSSQTRTIQGVSHRDNYLDDVLQMWTWQDNQTILQYYYDEPANTKWVKFKIRNFRERRRLTYRVEWSLEVDVIERG